MNDFKSFIEQLAQHGQQSNHRSVVVLSGPQSWATELLAEQLTAQSCCWLGDGPWSSCLAINKAKSVLGQEYQQLVFNGYSGVNPDACGVVSGTLAGGGICFIICPDFKEWPSFADPDYVRYVATPQDVDRVTGYFIRRAITIIKAQSSCYVLTPDTPLPELSNVVINEPKLATIAPYASEEQQHAVAQIVKTVTGHRRRPLVISADRGRGKSAALGIAAAELLASRVSRIIITAPTVAAVQSVFKHAALLLDGAQITKLCLTWQGKTIEFIAPDALIKLQPDSDLVLVDEAAAIPTAMLATLATTYSRLVFATTLHGYEGTGRGFALRFIKRLAEISPGYRTAGLNQPIRWAEQDPLEQLTYQLLGLKSEAANVDSLVEAMAGKHGRQQLEFSQLSQRQLLDNPSLLEQLFGLLVLAHYQTSPSDFRQLLDAPDLTIFIATIDQQLVATALVLTEGDIKPALAQQIWLGQRRLRGHLLPQSLMAQVGLQEAGAYRYGRIMRIAVQPQLHRNGIGLQLDQQIEQWAQANQLDFIGASFGATADLLDYWQALNYQPLRLGLNRDSASGTHSAIVLKPLQVSEPHQQLINLAQQNFYHNLGYALSAQFEALEFELVVGLLSDVVGSEPLKTQDLSNIEVFTAGGRPFELVAHSIAQLIWSKGQQLTQLSTQFQQILILKVLQQQSWSACCRPCGTSGRKGSEALLRQAVTMLLSECAVQ